MLRNTVVFYQDSSDIENKSIFFRTDTAQQTFEEEFDPVVLENNKQIYREIKQPVSFENLYLDNDINFKDTIRISLAVGFINEFGKYSTNYIPMGWLTLDSLKIPENYSFNYLSMTLLGDNYLSQTKLIRN